MTTNLLLAIVFMICLPTERRYLVLIGVAVLYVAQFYVVPFVAPSLVWLFTAATPGATFALVGIIFVSVFLIGMHVKRS
jgi:hypothetical protein